MNITIDEVLHLIESDEYLKNIVRSSEYVLKTYKPYFSHRNVSVDQGRCAMKHFWEENRPSILLHFERQYGLCEISTKCVGKIKSAFQIYIGRLRNAELQEGSEEDEGK